MDGLDDVGADQRIVIRRDGVSVVVTVGGALDAATIPPLRALLDDLIDGQGNLTVVIDLAALRVIDAAGCTLLAATAHRLTSRRGRLTVANPNAAADARLRALGPSDLIQRRPRR